MSTRGNKRSADIPVQETDTVLKAILKTLGI